MIMWLPSIMAVTPFGSDVVLTPVSLKVMVMMLLVEKFSTKSPDSSFVSSVIMVSTISSYPFSSVESNVTVGLRSYSSLVALSVVGAMLDTFSVLKRLVTMPSPSLSCMLTSLCSSLNVILSVALVSKAWYVPLLLFTWRTCALAPVAMSRHANINVFLIVL